MPAHQREQNIHGPAAHVHRRAVPEKRTPAGIQAEIAEGKARRIGHRRLSVFPALERPLGL
jgi:hypothetical protein